VAPAPPQNRWWYQCGALAAIKLQMALTVVSSANPPVGCIMRCAPPDQVHKQGGACVGRHQVLRLLDYMTLLRQGYLWQCNNKQCTVPVWLRHHMCAVPQAGDVMVLFRGPGGGSKPPKPPTHCCLLPPILQFVTIEVRWGGSIHPPCPLLHLWSMWSLASQGVKHCVGR
jgi:hypothetical protein